MDTEQLAQQIADAHGLPTDGIFVWVGMACGRITRSTWWAEPRDLTLSNAASSEEKSSLQQSVEELRDAMYEQGKGTWYGVRVELRPDGAFDIRFAYERPQELLSGWPAATRDEQPDPFDPSTYADDLQRYPREA